MHTIHDLLDSKPGDILCLDGPLDSLVDNLICFEKWATIDKHPLNYYVCQIMNYPNEQQPSLTTNQLLELYGMSNSIGDTHTYIRIPNGVKPESFRAKIYRKLGNKPVTFSIFENYIKMEPKYDQYRDILKAIKQKDEHYVDLSEIKDFTKFVSGVHREAKKQNIKVGTKRISDTLRLWIKKDTVEQNKTSRAKTVLDWFKSIRYDDPYLINDILFKDIDIAYVMTVLSKYGYDYETKGGTVTKRHYSLKRNHGKVVLSIDGKIVHVFNATSVNAMTDKMWSMVDMLLMPYGYKRYD